MPVPQAMACGGVATGIMNAPLAVMAAGTGSALSRDSRGLVPCAFSRPGSLPASP